MQRASGPASAPPSERAGRRRRPPRPRGRATSRRTRRSRRRPRARRLQVASAASRRPRVPEADAGRGEPASSPTLSALGGVVGRGRERERERDERAARERDDRVEYRAVHLLVVVLERVRDDRGGVDPDETDAEPREQVPPARRRVAARRAPAPPPPPPPGGGSGASTTSKIPAPAGAGVETSPAHGAARERARGRHPGTADPKRKIAYVPPTSCTERAAEHRLGVERARGAREEREQRELERACAARKRPERDGDRERRERAAVSASASSRSRARAREPLLRARSRAARPRGSARRAAARARRACAAARCGAARRRARAPRRGRPRRGACVANITLVIRGRPRVVVVRAQAVRGDEAELDVQQPRAAERLSAPPAPGGATSAIDARLVVVGRGCRRRQQRIVSRAGSASEEQHSSSSSAGTEASARSRRSSVHD